MHTAVKYSGSQNKINPVGVTYEVARTVKNYWETLCNEVLPFFVKKVTLSA